MSEDDIRNRPAVDHADICALNFIRSSPSVVFRRHFRQGLRSHIMEILDPFDVEVEQSGKHIDGVVRFPRATPRMMFRIFRARLRTLENALNEIARVKMVERYLAPGFMATSAECIVDYRGPDGWDLILCGFQEYVSGEILDPWTLLSATELLPMLHGSLDSQDAQPPMPLDQWITTVLRNAAQFIERTKRMITEFSHIPDLAGAGNLIVTHAGDIRLVDINNITPVYFENKVSLDEKGYPVCDKSVEALALIEEKYLGRRIDRNDPLYRHFLNPERRSKVKEKEVQFWDEKTR